MSNGQHRDESAIAALRAQILANARVLYRDYRTTEVLTSNEIDSSELVISQHWAYLVAINPEAQHQILSCSEPCDSREDALRSLLDDIEAEMGEMIVKELRDQKTPVERRRRRRERQIEESRLVRSS